MTDVRLRRLHAWLGDHNGVVTRRDLLAMGFTNKAIRWLLATERLVAEWYGIYRCPTHPFGRPQVMTAVCLHLPQAAIGFTTAGQELRFRGMGDEHIHTLVPHGDTPTFEGVVVHRCRRIDEIDLAGRRRDGVRLTSPPRTLFDASAILSDDAAASAVEQALAEHRCTIGTLMATLARLRHPRRPGAARFEAVLSSRPLLRGAARSELERIVRTAIVAAGLPAPLVNMRFVLEGGEMIVIDLAWPDWRVAVEVDHPFWHDGAVEAARDKRRDRKLAAMGWATPRITKHDVEVGLAEAVQDVGRVLARRGCPVGDAAA